jgi:hypothetical protein
MLNRVEVPTEAPPRTVAVFVALMFWAESNEATVVVASDTEPLDCESDEVNVAAPETPSAPERFNEVPVALPLIVVEAKETTPPDWTKAAFRVVVPTTVNVLETLTVLETFNAPPIVKSPKPVLIGPLLAVWNESVPAPTSMTVPVALVMPVNDESPTMPEPLNVIAARAAATPTATKTKPNETKNAMTFLNEPDLFSMIMVMGLNRLYQ